MITTCPQCGTDVEYLHDRDGELVMLDAEKVATGTLPDAVEWSVEKDEAVNLAKRWSEWRAENPAAERPKVDEVRVEHRHLCPELLSMTSVVLLPAELRDAVVERAAGAIRARDGGTDEQEGT